MKNQYFLITQIKIVYLVQYKVHYVIRYILILSVYIIIWS